MLLDDDGRIAYVGPAGGDSEGRLSTIRVGEILEAAHGTVLPGLIDTHVHLTFGTSAAHAAMRPEAPLEPLVERIRADGEAERSLRAAEAARASLAAGVTTVRDAGAAGRATHALRDLITARAIVGPRVLVSGTPITTRGGHTWWLGGEADSDAEVISLLRAIVRDGADGVKIMATGGGMTPGSNRLRAQYSASTLAAAVEDAHRLGRRVSAHAHGLEGIAHCVESGVDMIEHASWETESGLRLDEEVAVRLVRAGTYLGDTIIGHTSGPAKVGKSPDQLTDTQRQRFAIFRRLRELGARVVTSSDSMYPTTPFEDFPWAVVASSVYGGLAPEAAVHSATGLAAEAISLESQVGTLAAGKCGDLLVVDGDVGADVRNLPRTRWVLRDGVVVASQHGVWTPGQT